MQDLEGDPVPPKLFLAPAKDGGAPPDACGTGGAAAPSEASPNTLAGGRRMSAVRFFGSLWHGSVLKPPKDAGQRSEVAGSRQSRYNSVVMVAHTVPGALLIPEPTDTAVRPWG